MSPVTLNVARDIIIVNEIITTSIIISKILMRTPDACV